MTRVFYVLLWLLLSTAPAWADLSFGVVPASNALLQTRQQATELSNYLEERLQQPVRLRIFNSESLLHKWLNRYREVDIAVISRAYFDSKRQGEFNRLVDFQPLPDSQTEPSVLVGRQGLSKQDQQRLRDVLLVMDTDESGAKILQQMQLQSFSGPGTQIVLSRPKPAVQRVSKKAVKRPQPAPQPKKPVIPEPVQTAAAKQGTYPLTNNLEPPPLIEEAPSVPETPVQVARPAAPAPVEQPAEQPPVQSATVTPSEGTAPEAVTSSTSRINPEAKKPSSDSLPDGDKSPYSRKVQQAQAEPQAEPGSGRKYLLAIVLVLLVGAAGKLFLIYQRRPRQRPAIPSTQMRMHHDWSELHQGQPAEISASTASVETPAPPVEAEPNPPQPAPPMTEPTPPESDSAPFQMPTEATGVPQGLPNGQLQLDGNLGPRQIPAMLQLIAASGQSGTLTVSASHNEKRLTFSRGKITTASSRNISNQNQSGFLMNKLGYLLVRQGKITEEQRDQALVMCEGDSSLRLGEALLKMGALKRVELQRSLCDQAKMILHSLIVFPEGRFEFTAGDPQVTPEDNLRLGVNDFLKEAAAHQNEWRSIREMIPSLDTVLEFAPGGQEKVGSGRMTVHQKFVLSLIDGERPIRDICITATMLDYELYRFLYLMTKANILQRSA